jgi:very-short-patch-repair endonuclease
MYLNIEINPTINLTTLLKEYTKIGKGKPKYEKKRIRKEYEEVKKQIKALRKQYYKEIGEKCTIEKNYDWLEKFAEENRQKATKQEKQFEDILIQNGIEYEKQKPITLEGTSMILDFYIPSINLAIEIDGGYHLTEKQTKKDCMRDRLLKKYNFRLMRVPNEFLDLFRKRQRKSIIK